MKDNSGHQTSDQYQIFFLSEKQNFCLLLSLNYYMLTSVDFLGPHNSSSHQFIICNVWSNVREINESWLELKGNFISRLFMCHKPKGEHAIDPKEGLEASNLKPNRNFYSVCAPTPFFLQTSFLSFKNTQEKTWLLLSSKIYASSPTA